MSKIFITEYDPETSSEGSLNPLGLSSIADRMAVKLVPGFRERMSHPRFLTLIAIGANLCNRFNENRIAADGVSEPWQVYEWYVVQALVKKYSGTDEIRGLPGSDKTLRALKDNLPLSSGRYLKTASVFGFHGVYRTLASNLDVVNDGKLGETGDNLLRTWENEQDLNGFYMDIEGNGKNFKNNFYKAIDDGLNKGEVDRKWNWWFFDKIAEHFAIYKAGKKEKDILYKILLKESDGYRKEIIELLINYKNEFNGVDSEENVFHDYAIRNSYNQLNELLLAIKLYEKFARLMTNAFYDILYSLSRINRPVQIDKITNNKYIKIASNEIPEIFDDLYSRLENYSESVNFEKSFSEFKFKSNNTEFCSKLLEHHIKIQKDKPPTGKLPWIEHFQDGRYMIRPLYSNNAIEFSESNYVHQYRTNPLLSFLKDLNRINAE